MDATGLHVSKRHQASVAHDAVAHLVAHAVQQLGGGFWSYEKSRRWMYLEVGDPSKPATHIIATEATLNQYLACRVCESRA